MRKVLRIGDEENALKPHISLIGMIKSAVDRGMISRDVLPSLQYWIQLRNGIVHSKEGARGFQRNRKNDC